MTCNLLSLNFDKTYVLQFKPKNSYKINKKISCDNKLIKETRYVKHLMSQDILRTIYFSYFHSNLSCGIISWGNSAYSSDIFKICKRIIRIIMNARNRGSFHQVFKNLKIIPFKSQ